MDRIRPTAETVKAVYDRMGSNLSVIRRRLGRPLSYAEKVLLSHLDDPENQELEAGKSYLYVRPDRVAMQDATAQMALLQFMRAGKKRVAVPATVHCDHLIQASVGAKKDMENAIELHREVYDFLHTASRKYGIGFWKPGSGIIHQVVLENYAFPGSVMIGTDSHTPNAGGLGMFASGVGGGDAVDVMAGLPWEVLYPKRLGVRLTGKLSGWAAPKDVILQLCGALTVKGGTNKVVEYFGPGVKSISATGKATITNMGAELGATTSIFPFDERIATYLRATGRGGIAEVALKCEELLRADPEVEEEPEKFFDEVFELDLAKLEPQIVGPHTPDLCRPVTKLSGEVRKKSYPEAVSAALIGSCTNSSYEDIARARDVAEQAVAHGLKAMVPLFVSPGSELIRQTAQQEGSFAPLEEIGATVLANACGPCIGQWKRTDLQAGEQNAILTSFNRNFPRRNDGNPGTMAFIASPEIVVAYALAGRLSFNPLKDELADAEGRPFRLRAPRPAAEVPSKGFGPSDEGYVEPAEDGSGVEVVVSRDSARLALLDPFSAWDGEDFRELPLLLKAKGKCTTDHISPAGPWLRFRGHLDRISDNLFSGAVNAFTGAAGQGLDQLSGEADVPFAKIARRYKENGSRWVVVGDENYGEGSSREHAAMSPRHLGAAAVIVRSFARIHESNLKKQGILPLTFADPADYDKVQERDRLSLRGLRDLSPGSPLSAVLHHRDGSSETIELRHSMNGEQINWFKAGCALNLIAARETG